MNQVEQHAEGFKLAKRIARRLLQQYVHISREDNVITWVSGPHRDTYYWLCDTWRLRREA